MSSAENKIYFVDVTNRDGVQTSRLGLAKLQKTIINLMLDDMGITQSEFGFPITRHELNYLNGNLELVDRGVITKTKLSGWMRALASDVVQSFQNVPRLKYVNLSQSTSDQMINGKYGGKKTREDIIKKSLAGREIAEKLFEDENNFSILASETEDFVIADITETINKCVKTSIDNYVDKLTLDDLQKAFKQRKEEKIKESQQ